MKNGRKASANGGLAGLEQRGRPRGLSSVGVMRRELILQVMREKQPMTQEVVGLSKVWTEYTALLEQRRDLYDKATEMGLPLGSAVNVEVWLGTQKLSTTQWQAWYKDSHARSRYVSTPFFLVVTPLIVTRKTFVGNAALPGSSALELPNTTADDLAGVPPHMRQDPDYDPLEAQWTYVYRKLRDLGLPGHYGRRARETLYAHWRDQPDIPNLDYIKQKVREVYQEDPDQTYEAYEAARMVKQAQETSAKPVPAPQATANPVTQRAMKRTLQEWQHIIHQWGDVPTPEQEAQPDWLGFVERVRQQEGDGAVWSLNNALRELRRRAAEMQPPSPA